MIIYKCIIASWLLLRFSNADCDADKGCRDFKERTKRNSNGIIKDKTFKKVDVYAESVTVFDEYVWPR
jgi:hypothetical protein